MSSTVSLARSGRQTAQINTLSFRRVELRFQICPGTASNIGISGAEYVLQGVDPTLGANPPTYRGKTGSDGEVKLLLLPGETLLLRIFDTDYSLQLHTGLSPIPTLSSPTDSLTNANALRGIQQRLDILGYMTGTLRVPRQGDDVVTGRDDARLQQAILNFQQRAHRNECDGDLNDKTVEALLKEADAQQTSAWGVFERGRPEKRLLTSNSIPIRLINDGKVTIHRIVPLRFARAVTGRTDPTAPDLDDRGFRPVPLSRIRGPIVGLMPGRIVRVEVVNDRVGVRAAFYPLSRSPAAARVLTARDRRLVGNCVQIQGGRVTKGADYGDAKVEVHFGSRSGPGMAELLARVYKPITIDVRPHILSVESTQHPTVQPLVMGDLLGQMALEHLELPQSRLQTLGRNVETEADRLMRWNPGWGRSRADRVAVAVVRTRIARELFQRMHRAILDASAILAPAGIILRPPPIPSGLGQLCDHVRTFEIPSVLELSQRAAAQARISSLNGGTRPPFDRRRQWCVHRAWGQTPLLALRVPGYVRQAGIDIEGRGYPREMQILMSSHPQRNALNLYFVEQFQRNGYRTDPTEGFGVSRRWRQQNGWPLACVGAIVALNLGWDLLAECVAHEVGHCLGLRHPAGGNGNAIRHDLWAHRSLMHNYTTLRTQAEAGNQYPSSAVRTQVGYGATRGGPRPGALLGIKQDIVPTSDDLICMRHYARRRSYAPL